MIKKITKKQPTSLKRKELMKLAEDNAFSYQESIKKYSPPIVWETEKVTWESDMKKDEKRTGLMMLILVGVLVWGWWYLSN